MGKEQDAAHTGWSDPPELLSLDTHTVDVWRIALDVAPDRAVRLKELLAPDERDRADRYRFERDHDRFVAAHAALRLILSRYLNRDPRLLRFAYGRYGKPYLEATGLPAPCFNLSHSGSLALCAVTAGREVGIDVEALRPARMEEQIAAHFFSPQEVAALAALPDEQRHRAFYAIWTRKEAYIKASGDGLTVRLDSFDVSAAPDEPAQLLQTRDDREDATRWSLRDLDAGTDFRAALAIEGAGAVLRCWQWRW